MVLVLLICVGMLRTAQLFDRRTPVRVSSIDDARALLSQLTAEDLLAGRVVVSRQSLPRLDALSSVSAPMLSSLAGAL